MKIVSTHAEIKWAAEIRGQTEFLAQLPGVFHIQIFSNDAVTAAQLGIAEYYCRGWNAVGSGGGIGNKSAALYTAYTAATQRPCEDTRRRVEAVVIFSGPQKILIVPRVRCERQRRIDVVHGIEFERVVLRPVGRQEGGLNVPQIGGLGRFGIRIDGRIARSGRIQRDNEGQRGAERDLERAGRIKRGGLTALTSSSGRDQSTGTVSSCSASRTHRRHRHAIDRCCPVARSRIAACRCAVGRHPPRNAPRRDWSGALRTA